MEVLKENFIAFFTNRVLMCAVLSWIVAQILKIFTSPAHREEFSILRLLAGSGGMPSSHSAVVTGAAFSCGILYGFGSPLFAISAVLAVVVMRDAAGVRRESGKQAAAINQMSRELNKKHKSTDFDLLTELLGHTPLQVFIGGVLGIVMAYCCQLLVFPALFGPLV